MQLSRFVISLLLLSGLAACQSNDKPAEATKEPTAAPADALAQAQKPAPAPELATDPAPQAKPQPEQPEPLPAEPQPPVKAPEPSPEQLARQLLDDAIAAAGGLDSLKEKLDSYFYTSKGIYFGSPYTMTTTWKAPHSMLMGLEGGTTLMGYVGDQCWSKMGSVVLDCPDEEKRAAAEMLLVARWTSLYPLLDGGVKLAVVEGEKLGDKDVAALKVQKEDGSFAALLMFDKDKKTPAGVRYEGHFMGKEGTLETVILENKEFDSVLLPVKSVLSFNGEKIIEDEVTEMVFGTIQDGAFQRPETLAGVPQMREVPETLVASVVHKGPYQTLGMSIGMLYAWIGQSGLTPLGVPVQIYLKDPTTETDPTAYETEIRIPVAKPSKELPQHPTHSIKTVPAHVIVAQAEVGTYEKAAEAYEKLKLWVDGQGMEIEGPAGMYSFSNPMNTPADKLVNEVFFPVRKKQ